MRKEDAVRSEKVVFFEPRRHTCLKSSISLLAVIDGLIDTFSRLSENGEEFARGASLVREKIRLARQVSFDSEEAFPLIISALSSTLPVLQRISLELSSRLKRLQGMSQTCCSLVGEVNKSVGSIKSFLMIPEENCKIFSIDIHEKGD